MSNEQGELRIPCEPGKVLRQWNKAKLPISITLMFGEFGGVNFILPPGGEFNLIMGEFAPTMDVCDAGPNPFARQAHNGG
jgi:hypothetical protein